MPSTPVVLIAFNRPDLTRRTLQAVRPAMPERLFLLMDGPREEQPEDVRRCAEVRALIDEIDWPCQVESRCSEVNLGCEGNVETGLDWVFSRVDRAIVLEDDCVADPTFFGFADELLERYRDDARVWHVAGNSHGVPRRMFDERSYAFTTWAPVWGWATWADRWQRHRAVFPRDHARSAAGPYGPRGDVPRRSRDAHPRPGTLVTRAAERHFREAATSDDVVTHGWDKQWWLTIMSEAGLSVTPAVNLVENVGFGADATHTHAPGRRDVAAAPMTFPLRHPAQVAMNDDVERELELELARIGGRAAQVARRLVRSPMLRRALRATVNSAPARSAARHVSRTRRRSGSRGFDR